MLKLMPAGASSFNQWYISSGKGFFDRCGSFVLIIVLLPIMLLIGSLVRIFMGKNVIFAQSRAGLYGCEFICYKFRTMDHDRRKEHSSLRVNDRRKCISSLNDPRHNRFGTMLRRFGLDELPQLFNVLLGDMSLVGPRPEILDVFYTYTTEEKKRVAVKSGLTGYWQVTCRSESVDLRVNKHIDMEYINNISLLNDVLILFATPIAIFVMPAASECQR